MKRSATANVINSLYAIIYICPYFYNRPTHLQQRNICVCVYIYHIVYVYYIYLLNKFSVYVNYGAGTALDFGV